MIGRWWHPRSKLVAALEGRLSDAERARLDRHLAGCPACRAQRARLARTIAWLDASPVTSAAPSLPERSSHSLDERARSTSRPSPARLRWVAVGAASLLVALVALMRVAGSERIAVVAAASRISAFEAVALAEHRATVEGRATLECRATTAAGLRGWLAAIGKFSADLVEPQKGGASPAIELVGGWRARTSGPRGAVIAAKIDGLPATLLVGHAAEVTGIPEWSLLGKQLQVRHDAVRGEHLLSWRNAGKAYTLVTDPATPPQAACRLCHDSPRRLATIERVAGEL